jgi:hypothetical protein
METKELERLFNKSAYTARDEYNNTIGVKSDYVDAWLPRAYEALMKMRGEEEVFTVLASNLAVMITEYSMLYKDAKAAHRQAVADLKAYCDFRRDSE